MKNLFTLFFVCCSFSALAQYEPRQIDSLLNEARTRKEDTTKVNILLQLGCECMVMDRKETTKYTGLAMALAERLGYEKGIAESVQ